MFVSISFFGEPTFFQGLLIRFFDDFTSYGWVAFLKRKSDAYFAICDFEAMARNQYRATIKIFMSDGGGEYQSEKLKAKFRELGIKTHTSVPHMPQ